MTLKTQLPAIGLGDACCSSKRPMASMAMKHWIQSRVLTQPYVRVCTYENNPSAIYLFFMCLLTRSLGVFKPSLSAEHSRHYIGVAAIKLLCQHNNYIRIK